MFCFELEYTYTLWWLAHGSSLPSCRTHIRRQRMSASPARGPSVSYETKSACCESCCSHVRPRRARPVPSARRAVVTAVRRSFRGGCQQRAQLLGAAIASRGVNGRRACLPFVHFRQPRHRVDRKGSSRCVGEQHLATNTASQLMAASVGNAAARWPIQLIFPPPDHVFELPHKEPIRVEYKAIAQLEGWPPCDSDLSLEVDVPSLAGSEHRVDRPCDSSVRGPRPLGLARI
jgi:hypothetical protein